MNAFRKLAFKAATSVMRMLSIENTNGWHGNVGDAGEHVSDSSVLSLSAAWACVNLLSGTIASLPLMVYRRDSKGNREIYRDHPLYRLLHDSPNFDQTAVDFWEFISASLELRGNAYARIERGSRGVLALTPVNPGLVGVKRLQNGTLEYRWSYEGRHYIETDKTMLHIRGFGGNPLGGMSTLNVGRHTFSLARAIDKSAGATFRNGLRPSGVLTFEKWLSPEQRQLAESKMADKFQSAADTGKPMILEGGTKWEQLTIAPDDAQMLESRGFSVEEICRFFGVPPFMIGHTEKTTSWGSGLEQQTLGFQKFTLRRRLKRIEQAIEKQLLTPADRAAGVSVEFNLEGLLRGDTAGRARFYQQMTSIGAMTINEVRELENLPPVEGGDVPRMQMQNRPITEIDEDAVRQLIAQEREQSQ
ncbi:HK97 family phage portal protein [Rhizobium skierniewicense]|uniref:HK97 family phage portal protein n=2 Tax=Rhizobium skierniewicense TaxID=984260 RepID=A0A7W6C2V0_9HYPH|nr:HK97 family phage portal protein [Rhizobium skierniewicense]